VNLYSGSTSKPEDKQPKMALNTFLKDGLASKPVAADVKKPAEKPA